MNPVQTPVAVVGMACRFPGAASLDAYWSLLRDGVDAISDVPPDRWLPADFIDAGSHAAGKADVRWGGFIDGIDRFDAAFFGISPRETLGTSPQQRLLLEVAWHAVENAGIAMPDLASRPQTAGGPRTGVFVGVASFDYYDRVMQAPSRMDGYALTGNAYSVTANRLSYVFDLCGPSIAIDTACSSSLVAIHLAAQSLACGECSVALAGGSQVLLSPWVGVAASKGEFLAPDGRCKTFDAGANGYVRGEGIGVVVLKRLDDAQRDGDPIWAVVRGTAVNQDGRSNGLTAPNPAAQIDVIATALQRAGIGAHRVGYVEAHGTGTALGDPIEIQALGAVLGDRGDKCFVGSVKTNIGHLEAAAGVAGFIKAVLSVHHGEIAPNLHFRRPNPLIDFDRIPLAVPTELQRWSSSPGRVAGVSSFGFGGTNAHVVIEAPPLLPPCPAPLGGPGLLCLSARSKPALAALADRHTRWLVDHPQASWSGVVAAAAHGRALFTQRLAVVAGSAADAAGALREAAGRLRARGIDKAHKPGKPRLAMLFTGQGAQYVGMGRGLRDQFPAYAQLWRHADEVLVESGYEPLDAQVHAPAEPTNALTATARAQPALYVLQVGLWRLFQTWGVKPFAVLGHSVGEFAAAHCAGVLGFEQGLRLVARRAECMQACRADGAMLSVPLDRAAAQAVLRRQASACVIAAVNGPRDVVLSGPIADIEQLAAALRADGITTRRLEVSHAFHSPAMAPAARALAAAAEQTAHGRAGMPILSSVTAAALEHSVDWAAYWADQMLKPVDFDGALEQLAMHKPNLLIELGPRPVLAALAARRFGAAVKAVSALDPSVADLQQLHHVLAACFEAGIDVRAAVPKAQGARERIPGYAFEPQEHLLYPPVAALHAVATAPQPHAFLAASTVRVGGSGHTTVTIPLGSRRFPYLGEHTVFGADVLPATGYIELAQAAAYRTTGMKRWRLQDLEFRRALVLGADDTDVHVSLTAEGESRWRFIVTAGDPPADPSGVAAEEIYSSGVLHTLPTSAEQGP